MPGSGFRTFWEAGDAKDAIALLSGQARLVVFVGAGVSKEAGLPSWAELLDMLLRRTARASDPFRARLAELRQQGVAEPALSAQIDADAASYSRWVTATHGLLGAAAVVKAWLGSGDYHRVVQETLYSPVTDRRLPLQPGPTAIAVASLWKRLGPERMTAVTTNYDLLLERALEELGIDRSRIRTVVDLNDPISGTFEVVHLHGVLPEPRSSGAATPSKDIVEGHRPRRRRVLRPG